LKYRDLKYIIHLRSKYIIFVTFLFVSGILSFFTQSCVQKRNREYALTKEDRQWIANHQPILLAPDPNYPPIEFFDKHNNYQGIAADYIYLLEKKLKIEFKIIKLRDWEEILKETQNRRIDVIGAISETPDRSYHYLFTEPYLELSAGIFIRSNTIGKVTLDELKGMRVAIASGSMDLEQINRDYPDLDIDIVPDIPTGLRKVSFGMVDAMISDLLTATYFIEKEGVTNIREGGKTGYNHTIALAIRKDWPELLSILNFGLSQISKQEKKQILRKWVNLKEYTLFHRKEFWIAALIFFAVIFIIIFTILYWNRSLKKQVSQRTDQIQQELNKRKEIFKALQESEKKYKQVTDSVNDMIFTVDLDGNFTFVNKAVEMLTGYSRKELMSMNMRHIIAREEDLQLITKAVQKSMNGKKVKNRYEYQIKTKSGKKRIIEINISGQRTKQGRLFGFYGVARDITNRLKVEEKIKASLREKEVLLKEIHHRVKNNLSVVSSLLHLQSNYLKDKRDLELFRESQNRVQFMSLIHQKLYQSDDLASIDFGDYIQTLANTLFQSYSVYPGKIDLILHVDRISLNVHKAVPCGLIINELISNSLKYAFPENFEDQRKISIYLHSERGNEIELIVKDSGVGIPEEFEFEKSSTLGLKLVTMLVEDQLSGSIKMDRKSGTTFFIQFKI
jgi:PAS domain S-box-containing protein